MGALSALLTPFVWKTLGGMAMFAVLVFGYQKVTERYREQGRVEIRAEWTAQKYLDSQAQVQAVALRLAANEQQKVANELINEGTKNAYEKKLAEHKTLSDVTIAHWRAAGGLRITNACAAQDSGAGVAGQADAESAGGNHGAGSRRLPRQIEDDLFQYARDRDSEIILLGACQSWIRDNGFYP